ncbi:MAG: DoxX family protein [Simkaniaceae bacterium]
MKKFIKNYLEKEKRLSCFLKGRSITILTYAIGIIYLWYGLLKIFGESAAEQLVKDATYWIGIPHFDVILGFWEAILGFCLFFKKLRRIGLILLFLQFPGTFLPLFLSPENCFTDVPFGLTLEGKYIFKNIILVSAGLVLISSLHKKEELGAPQE